MGKKLSAEVDEPGLFIIQSRNKLGHKRRVGGEDFVCSIRGFSEVEDKLTDNGDGTYSCAFVCGGPSGNYKVAVMLDGKPLKGSPFKLKIKPNKDPYAKQRAIEAASVEDKKKKKMRKKMLAAKKKAKAAAKLVKPPKKPDESESDSETSEEDDTPGTSASSSDEEEAKKGAARR